MKAKWHITVLLCLLAGLFACKKDNTTTATTMQFTWEQTQCDDPWVNDLFSDANTIKNITQYLLNAGLSRPSLTVSLKTVSAPQANCTACNCKTGKVFYITIEQSDDLKQKYLQAGFKQ